MIFSLFDFPKTVVLRQYVREL